MSKKIKIFYKNYFNVFTVSQPVTVNKMTTDS